MPLRFDAGCRCRRFRTGWRPPAQPLPCGPAGARRRRTAACRSRREPTARRMPGAPRGPRRSRPRAALRRYGRLHDTFRRRSGRGSPPPRRRETSPTRRRRPRESRGGGCPGARGARRRSSALPLPAQPRDPMCRDIAEEAFRNIEAPDVLEAVQQPVDVSGIAARLELPEPDEPRHAGVDHLCEQIFKVAPTPGRAYPHLFKESLEMITSQALTHLLLP